MSFTFFFFLLRIKRKPIAKIDKTATETLIVIPANWATVIPTSIVKPKYENTLITILKI